MKNLLALCSWLTAFGGWTNLNLSCTSNLNQDLHSAPMLNKSQSGAYKSINFYWISPLSPFVFENFYNYQENITKYFYWEINIGNNNILNQFISWSAIDVDSVSETYATWGKQKFVGPPWKLFQERHELNNVDLNISGTVSNIDIARNVNIKMQESSDRWGFGWFKAQQWIGLSTFKRNHDYYLSVFGYQIVEKGLTLSGGQIYLNLGTGIYFEFF